MSQVAGTLADWRAAAGCQVAGARAVERQHHPAPGITSQAQGRGIGNDRQPFLGPGSSIDISLLRAKPEPESEPELARH